MEINTKFSNGFQFTIFHGEIGRFKRNIKKYTHNELLELDKLSTEVKITIPMIANLAYLQKLIGNDVKAVKYAKEFLIKYKLANKKTDTIQLLKAVEICSRILSNNTELIKYLSTFELEDRVCKIYLENKLFIEFINRTNNLELDNKQLQYRCLSMIQLGYGYSAIEEYTSRYSSTKFDTTYIYLLDKCNLKEDAIKYINSFEDPENINDLIDINSWLFKLGVYERFKNQFKMILEYYDKNKKSYIKGYIDRMIVLSEERGEQLWKEH